MRTVFADVGYWIMLLNADDNMHNRVLAVSQSLGPVQIVTSEVMIIEVLNYYAGFGPHFRKAAVGFVFDLYSQPSVSIVPLTTDLLGSAIAQYASRADKEWGLADCLSFEIMKSRSIYEALAYDHHFEQAGFRALLREG